MDALVFWVPEPQNNAFNAFGFESVGVRLVQDKMFQMVAPTRTSLICVLSYIDNVVYRIDSAGDGGVVRLVLAAVRSDRSIRNTRSLATGHSVLSRDTRLTGQVVSRLEPNHLRADRLVQDLPAEHPSSTTI